VLDTGSINNYLNGSLPSQGRHYVSIVIDSKLVVKYATMVDDTERGGQLLGNDPLVSPNNKDQVVKSVVSRTILVHK